MQVQDEAASIAEYCGGMIKVAQLTATMNQAAQVRTLMHVLQMNGSYMSATTPRDTISVFFSIFLCRSSS
jgi:hypothetical protein